MNGSEVMVRTLLSSGVDVCFANPGTSEMHFVSALDQFPRMRCVLGLFEGVVTGAADGYYRIADKPAATLLHLGPGLGNGLANLHNAKRANSGIVNIVGQHALDHIANDAPLTSDIEGVARPMSHWVRTTMSANAAPFDAAAAVEQARGTPGRVATLILPADAAWGECTVGEQAVQHARVAPRVDSARIEAIARVISEADDPSRVALLLGGRAMRADATALAGRIAARTGCRLLCETKSARAERGLGRVSMTKIPYPLDPSLTLLQDVSTLIVIGTPSPVAFFAYPGKPRVLMPPGSQVHTLVSAAEDVQSALADLCDALDAKTVRPAHLAEREDLGPLPTGRADSEGVSRVVGALMPENAIVVDEAITTGRFLPRHTAAAAPHDWLEITGGSIGYGLPAAVGAAIAAPDRRVIALVGDGSAMYTVQSLWTMAREQLDVTVVIFANRSYHILNGELAAMGAKAPGPNARRMLTLDSPDLDWVSMARAQGMPAQRVEDLQGFALALGKSLAERGPCLIELVM
jgi:acetolactate synthase-1/2/3 large subunit